VRLSVVFVHFHTPELAARAVAAVRRQAAEPAASGLEVEILVVDNGSDATGRERLAALPAILLEPGANLGYAGGVNLGARHATGEALAFANPDVEPLPGCLPALIDTLAAGAGVAGPRLYWDGGRRLLLPPAERRDRASELLDRLATRGEPWVRRARARWRRHARRHWEAAEPLASWHLSGALLAVSRPAWERVGPFDEGYRLYFEETDWLWRAARLGVPVVHQPRAEGVHRYNRSAAGRPEAVAWFEESRRRFGRRWYGATFRRLADAVTGGPGREPDWPPPLAPAAGPPRFAREGGAAPAWVEVSPSAAGYPAAGERLEAGSAGWELPAEVWEDLAPGRYRVTLVDEAGREGAAWSFRR
jgi:GT2 family glycosyltransferase